MPQYSADIVAILTVVASVLPSLIASPLMLYTVRIHESVALPIHRRAELLLKVAALKCAPVENLARVRTGGLVNMLGKGLLSGSGMLYLSESMSVYICAFSF